MATDNLPDLDELSVELIQLRHRQADTVRLYEKALERVALFPNEVEQTRAAALATILDEMAARIEYLDTQLLPIRRHEGQRRDGSKA
jgi:hypothetical protein